MAQKPDGKPARTERMTFTRPAAERIAKAVRRIEFGDRDCQALTFERAGSVRAAPFRMATFTGSWSKTATKTVTLRASTATLAAVNLFVAISGGAAPKNCAVAKDGTAWYLIAAECG